MIPRLLTLALLTSLAVSASAQTAFEPVADQIRAQPINIAAAYTLVSLTPNEKKDPRESYSVTRTLAADGTVQEERANALYQTSQSFRADGTLLTSRVNDLRRGIVTEAHTSADRSSIETVVTEKGKVKSDKKMGLKPGVVLREEIQGLILQSWEYGIRDGLKFQSLSPDGGMLGDFQIVFKTAADPTTLSKKYTYPAEFKTFLATRNSYVVADMSLQGFAAFFYPHHFYLIYVETTSGLELVAYYGEDPSAPTFQMITNG